MSYGPDTFAGRDAVVVFEKSADPGALDAVRSFFERLEGPIDIEINTWRDPPGTLQLWVARG